MVLLPEFTLYGDARKGDVQTLLMQLIPIKQKMDVLLNDDGPVTLMTESTL
jgi:D-Tyr-tRNAtyr deacylase